MSEDSCFLSWSTNTEPDLAGYNIYRNNIKINTTLITTTTYTDTNVTNGTTYSYSITAVDTNNNESLKSTSVSATPNPTKVWITSIEPSDIDPLGFDSDQNNDN